MAKIKCGCLGFVVGFVVLDLLDLFLEFVPVITVETAV